MKERRSNKRYYFRALLRFAEAGEYSNMQMESINVSAGGIFFRTNTKINVGEELNFVFSLPDYSNPIEVRCKAVHSVETIPGKQYFVGVEFKDLKGIESEELQKYLEARYGQNESND